MNHETQHLEYKKEWRTDFLAELAGMANAKGGTLVIGIDDKGCAVGVDNAKKLLEDIPNQVRDGLGLVADVNLVKVDGVNTIEVAIGPSRVAISYKGKYYYRSGSTNQLMTGQPLNDFLFSKTGLRWDAIVSTRATIDDVDPEAVKYFLKMGIMAGRIDRSAKDDDVLTVLRNLDCIAENGYLNNAGILLFAKNPKRFIAGSQFKLGRFGRNDADLMFQDVVEGNVLQMVDRVIVLLRSKYLYCPIHYEGMVRMEPLEVPEDGLREILYNAIVHKSYTGSPIQMKVFNDYIEVWNEGELPYGTTVETFLERHESRPGNPGLADAFFRAGFVEMWGRGFTKIKDSFEGAGYPMPLVERMSGSMCVTIKRRNPFTFGVPETGDVVNNVVNNVGVNVGVNVGLKSIQPSKRQKDILRLALNTPTITIEEMSVKMSVNKRTIERDINRLRELRSIYREGSDKAGHWVVTEKGKSFLE